MVARGLAGAARAAAGAAAGRRAASSRALGLVYRERGSPATVLSLEQLPVPDPRATEAVVDWLAVRAVWEGRGSSLLRVEAGLPLTLDGGCRLP